MSAFEQDAKLDSLKLRSFDLCMRLWNNMHIIVAILLMLLLLNIVFDDCWR